MSKLNKNFIWVIVIMGLLIMGQQGNKKEAGESFVRSFSKNVVSPGETFTATYTATSSDMEWFVGFGDTVSCGNPVEGFMLSNAGQSPKSEQYTFTAPQSGVCTLTNGWYQFTNSDKINLNPVTITISGSGNNGGSPGGGSGGSSSSFGSIGVIVGLLIGGFILYQIFNKK